MAAIGIDTHKRTLAACAVDAVGGVIDERTFDCDPAGFVELAAWAGGVAPEARIGIEGSASYGAPVAHHLIAAWRSSLGHELAHRGLGHLHQLREFRQPPSIGCHMGQERGVRDSDLGIPAIEVSTVNGLLVRAGRAPDPGTMVGHGASGPRRCREA